MFPILDPVDHSKAEPTPFDDISVLQVDRVYNLEIMASGGGCTVTVPCLSLGR